MIGLAKEQHGLYIFQITSLISPSVNSSFHNFSLDLWHYRLGHSSIAKIQVLNKSIQDIGHVHSDVCMICPLTKQKRLHFPNSVTISGFVFSLIHCDVWGPLSTASYDGYRYFLSIVDDYTRCTWIYLLKFESEV